MRLLVLFIALYFPPVAVSAEIGMVLGSFHFSRSDLNEFNPGVYVVSDAGVFATFYKNSFYDWTVAGGYRWRINDYLSFTLGGVYGYGYDRETRTYSEKQHGADLLPFVLFNLSLPMKRFRVNLNYFGVGVGLSAGVKTQ